MSELKIKTNFSNTQIVIFLGILLVISVIFRMVVFPYDLPIPQDGEVYFWYANDMSLTKSIPYWGETYFPNTLWPTFLSIFFSFFSSNNFVDYMELQRTVTLGLSVLTAIPIFFLTKIFLRQKYAIVATGLFLFDPKLIQNSLSGLTEPLFLLLATCSILLYLNKRMSLVYCSFVVLALATLTRYEIGIIIIPFSVLFFWRHKNPKKIIHLLICLTIFFTIIFVTDYIRSENTNANAPTLIDHFIHIGFFKTGSNAEAECDVMLQDCISNTTKENSSPEGFQHPIINLVKYYGWMTIPLFFIFLPIGLYKFFQNRNFEKWTIIICTAFMLLPAIYIFSRDFQEMRYLYIQIPFLCIIGATSIEFFSEKIKKPNILILVFLIGIILAGGIFYYDQILVNYEIEREYYEISKKINSMMTASNEIFPADNYIRSGTIEKLEEFPVLRNSFNYFSVNMIPNDQHDSLEELIQFGKDNHLKHLVIDTDGDGINYLYDIFHNEEKYQFLEKIYDSKSDGFTYHVKFFKIKYDEFNKNYGYGS